MYRRTEIWTLISHPAISRCDKNHFQTGHKFHDLNIEFVQGGFKSI